MGYYIGLDIGTSSVGWAVIDEKTELARFKRQSMWGVRKFDEAETAASRREYRSARRRLNRRKKRIENLQMLMDPLVSNIDKSFFHRLEESYRYDSSYQYNLFVDDDFTDKDFYEMYPTIYHLREKLMFLDEKADARLIYLALHHIVKHRGHFLFEGQDLSVTNEKVIEDILNRYIEEKYVSDLVSILKKDVQPSVKRNQIVKLLGKDYREFASAIVGLKINFKKMFAREDEAFYKNLTIFELFDDEKNDGDLSGFDEEEYRYLEDCFKIYSWVQLQDILMGFDSISQSKVKNYDDHKKDLKDAKFLFKKYDRDSYKAIFKGSQSPYEEYRKKGHQNQDSLNNTVLKALKSLEVKSEDKDKLERLLERTQNKSAFPLQKNIDNAAIPYQIHLYEAQKIMEKQSQYYPELNAVKDKILSLITFRIPYYVGPLDDRSQYTSVYRKKNVPVYPWNFHEVVDVEKSSEQFIENLTSFCTYIPGEKVLPKNSVYYQMYEVYNELNGIRIDGEKLSSDLKNHLVHDLFMQKKSVTDRTVRKYLIEKGYYLENEYPEIKGYQKETGFASSLSSVVDFRTIFDNWENHVEEIEKIILWLTIFKDKKLLRRRLERDMTDLSEKQIQSILKLNYDGWGRFSRKLLVELYSEDKYGYLVNILDVMKEEPKVFMQVIHDGHYQFNNQINELQKEAVRKEITYEDVDELRASPAIKKGIWQSLRLVDEIVKLRQEEPKGIFIEMARSSEAKRRSKSRYEKLEEIYKKDKELSEIYEELKANSHQLTKEKVYLYFTQRGKCMYSGQSLDIHQLEKYHVDHIIPQSVIKDDSLDNKVLVLGSENIRKSDSIFIDPKVIHRMQSYWEGLLDKNLISKKKYFNLSRKASAHKEEEIIRGFIQRQLVETRQITQHVRNILEGAYTRTTVVPLRANLVTLFRAAYNIPKSRLVNDFHHAHDAYLTASLGVFTTIRFPQMTMGKYYHKDVFKIPDKIKQNYILHEMKKVISDQETGEVIWNGEENIATMVKMLKRKDVKITKQCFEHRGAFYKETIYSPSSGKKNLIPISEHRKPVEKYGGYEGLTISYLQVVKGKDLNNKNKKIIANVPLLYRFDEKKLREYIQETYRIDKIDTFGRKLYLNQLINLNGQNVRVKSSSEVNNDTQLLLSEKNIQIVSLIEKKKYDRLNDLGLEEVYKEIQEKLAKFYPLYQNIAIKMEEQMPNFKKLSIQSKADALENILIAIGANASRMKVNDGDFKLGEIGRLSKNLNSRNNEIYVIDESITGLYCRKTRVI